MRNIPKTCLCCGSDFLAGSHLAKWCSSRCTMRAYLRRRRGAPEADPGVRLIAPRVLQPEILDDPDELPAAWAMAAEPAGLECRHWNGTAIQRRESDGYVNATAMCKAGGKRLNDYLRVERTQEYIRALAASVAGERPCGAAVAGFPATVAGLIDIHQGGHPHLQGTWIHPRLAVDLARWISPAFAVWMDGWFLESLSLPAPRREPQLPQLPPGGPAILIRAKTHREAAQVWADALEEAAASAIRRRYSVRHRGPDTLSLPACIHWQHVPA